MEEMLLLLHDTAASCVSPRELVDAGGVFRGCAGCCVAAVNDASDGAGLSGAAETINSAETNRIVINLFALIIILVP